MDDDELKNMGEISTLERRNLTPTDENPTNVGSRLKDCLKKLDKQRVAHLTFPTEGIAYVTYVQT
jgi:hypothetical protein